MGSRALEHITYAEYLQSPHWKRVRWAAIWAARGRCQLCGAEQDLEVHHRDYDSLGCETPDDVTVLCRRCHAAYSLGQVPGAPAREAKTQKSVAFTHFDRAELDAQFVSRRDGTATITECRCYGKPRFYVGTNPMPGSRRHDPAKHRELSQWKDGKKS